MSALEHGMPRRRVVAFYAHGFKACGLEFVRALL
jgi:hypothetical protein